jgi:hypothetical protein
MPGPSLELPRHRQRPLTGPPQSREGPASPRQQRARGPRSCRDPLVEARAARGASKHRERAVPGYPLRSCGEAGLSARRQRRTVSAASRISPSKIRTCCQTAPGRSGRRNQRTLSMKKPAYGSTDATRQIHVATRRVCGQPAPRMATRTAIPAGGACPSIRHFATSWAVGYARTRRTARQPAGAVDGRHDGVGGAR